MQYRQAPCAIFLAIFKELGMGEGVPARSVASRQTSPLWL